MIDRPDGLFWISEARLLELCRVKRTTWRAWDSEGLVERDDGGAYSEADALSVVLILALRNVLSAQDTAAAWRDMQRRGADSEVIATTATLGDESHLDLIVEPESRVVRYAATDEALIKAVRFLDDPRSVIVVSVAGKLRRVRDGFRVLKEESARPTERRVGRPTRIAADVLPLRQVGG
jgi:hypothetical protein